MKNLLQPFILIAFIFLSFSLQAQLFEDFEQGTKNYYASGQDVLETGEWTFVDALIGTTAGDKKNGLKSARIRNGHIEMNFDYPYGLVEVAFYGANFGDDTGGQVQLKYSTDEGDTWNLLGEPVSLTSQLVRYTVSGSVEGDVRVRFTKTAGNRINIDDVLITDYIDVTPEPRLLLTINDTAYEHGSTFDFGLNTGQAEAILQIRNGGEQDLVISSHAITGEGFSVEGDLNVTLSSLETAAFNLLYESDTPGIKTGSLTLNTNDPDNEEFTVNLVTETLDTTEPIPISVARGLPQGTAVTVAGWVTVASQFAGPVYFQDETGGIAWYNNDIMREEWLVGAIIGDSIVVSGELGNFHNLIQIINDTGYEVFPEGFQEQEPLQITLEDLNTGDYEGWLVRITDLEFSNSGIFSGGTNYTVTDPSGEGQVRVDNFTNIPGTVIPTGLTEVTGVAGRFQDMKQLLPRFAEDIVEISGPRIISVPPYEVSSTPTSITFEWETELEGHSEIRYGTTSSFEMGKVICEELKTGHSLTINDLSPAMAYKVQLRSAFDPDTSMTSIYISSTASPEGSTGEILSYFNKDVAHELSTYGEANQDVDFSEKFIEYIQTAEETLEIAFYNLSGDVGSSIAGEIIEAHNRGVDVRVIISGHTGSVNELVTHMAAAGVKAVQSIGDEQMHNKFAVIDAHHSDPSKPRIITGSWNATDLGTYGQYQNKVSIQDVALARAYWYEFNQMWGGESGDFNATQARFGPEKTVVNPSVFWIGEENTRVEVYFSPQGGTEAQINRSIASAQENIDLCLNLITRRTISHNMRERFDQGVKVRGAIGFISGQGNEWDYLSSWADVHHFPQADFGLLHHKYAIIDGEVTGYNSKVITGSHNWSANANFRNDENTLIIHSGRVANEFLQEFGARYWQAGGQDEFDPAVSIGGIGWEKEEKEFFLENFPNPFRSVTNIRFQLASAQNVSIRVYDITGNSIGEPVRNEPFAAGIHTIGFDASGLKTGLYFYRLVLEDGRTFTGKMSVVK